MRWTRWRSATVLGVAMWTARSLGCDPSASRNGFVDTDGDGLSDADERSVYGTSPLLADTDGDGMSDHTEIMTNAFDPENAPLLFNPRVADVPEMELTITSPPLISFILTDVTGETRTFETSRTTEEGTSVSAGTTTTTTEGNTVGETDTVSRQRALTREVSGGLSLTQERSRDAGSNRATAEQGGAVSITVTDGVSSTVARARSSEISLSFSTEQIRELRQALTNAESYAQTHELSASGGMIEVLVVIANRGNLPFRISNLLLAGALVMEDGVEVPVGNLELYTNLTSYQPYSLAPGQQHGPVNFIENFITLEQVAALVRNAEGLVVRVGVYELTNADNKPYVFNSASIQSRTATVEIDYGDHRKPEHHLVATNLDPGRPGVSMDRALREILRIPFECDADAGVISIRGVPENASDGGRWCLHHRRNGDDDDAASPACSDDVSRSCTRLELRAGDLLRLTWIGS